MIGPPERASCDTTVHQPGASSEAGKGLTTGWAKAIQRDVNRARLVALGGLALLVLGGAAGGDGWMVAGAALLLGIAVAAGQEVVLRRWHRGWLAVAAGAADGLTAAAVVYGTGGADSGLDVLFPVAILALAAQPSPGAALALATFDTWLYVPAVLAHPGYVPEEHLGVLATRVLLFGLMGAGAYVVAKAGVRLRRELEVAQRRWEAETEEVDEARRLVLGRANLIAMLAHDLRTPLTSVKGFSQLMLRDRSASEETQRYAGVILAETNRAIRTIGDAVDLAQMQSGRGDLEHHWIDLKPIIEAAVAALEHHDPEGRVRLNVQAPLPMVRADPARIERIMVNLISNALRYSQDGAPIEVGAAAEGAGVQVWVKDEGRGIPPEKYAHIFDLGADDTLDESGLNGSGLGLYISKHLVEAHGGQMWVEGAEGRGSRFAFRLRS